MTDEELEKLAGQVERCEVFAIDALRAVRESCAKVCEERGKLHRENALTAWKARSQDAAEVHELITELAREAEWLAAAIRRGV